MYGHSQTFVQVKLINLHSFPGKIFTLWNKILVEIISGHGCTETYVSIQLEWKLFYLCFFVVFKQIICLSTDFVQLHFILISSRFICFHASRFFKNNFIHGSHN